MCPISSTWCNWSRNFDSFKASPSKSTVFVLLAKLTVWIHSVSLLFCTSFTQHRRQRESENAKNNNNRDMYMIFNIQRNEYWLIYNRFTFTTPVLWLFRVAFHYVNFAHTVFKGSKLITLTISDWCFSAAASQSAWCDVNNWTIAFVFVFFFAFIVRWNSVGLFSIEPFLLNDKTHTNTNTPSESNDVIFW